MYIENNTPNRNGEESTPSLTLYSKAELVIHDLENLKHEGDFESLLEGQAKLKRPLAHFSREDVETLTSYCVLSLKEAVESDSPLFRVHWND